MCVCTCICVCLYVYLCLCVGDKVSDTGCQAALVTPEEGSWAALKGGRNPGGPGGLPEARGQNGVWEAEARVHQAGAGGRVVSGELQVVPARIFNQEDCVRRSSPRPGQEPGVGGNATCSSHGNGKRKQN